MTAVGRRWPGGLSSAAAASAAWWLPSRSRPPASSTGWAHWAPSTRRRWPPTACWPASASGCWAAAPPPWDRRWAPGLVSARPGRPRRSRDGCSHPHPPGQGRAPRGSATAASDRRERGGVRFSWAERAAGGPSGEPRWPGGAALGGTPRPA